MAEILSEPICKHRKPENFVSSAVSAEEQNKHDPVSGCSAQYSGLLAWAEKKWASVKFSQVALALPLCLELPSRDLLSANSPHPDPCSLSCGWGRGPSVNQPSGLLACYSQCPPTLSVIVTELSSCLHNLVQSERSRAFWWTVNF